MAFGALVSSITAFLRAGYPSGAPAVGYVPLLALLPRRVSDDEVAAITGKLRAPARRRVDDIDIGVEITRVTHEMPSLNDIERVRRRLGAVGRPGNHQG